MKTRTFYQLAVAVVATIVLSLGGGDVYGQCETCTFGTAAGSDAVSAGGFVDGSESGAFGTHSTVYGEESFGIGDATVGASNADADGSFAIGIKAFTYGDNSISIGHKVEVPSSASNSYVFGYGSTNDNLVNDESNSIMLGVNSDEPTVFIEGASGSGTWGRVGIGTTDPEGILHLVEETSTNTRMVIEAPTNQVTEFRFQHGNDPIGFIGTTGGQSFVIRNDADDEPLIFATSPSGASTEAMRIRGNNGFVGIGTVALGNPTQRLHVSDGMILVEDDEAILTLEGDGTANDAASIRFTDNSAGGDDWEMSNRSSDNQFRIQSLGTTTTTPFIIESGADDDAMRIDDAGNVGIGTSNPTGLLELGVNDAIKPGGGDWDAPSDFNLKQDISEFTDGLEILLQFQPKRFRYNGTYGLSSNEYHVGVVAQDLLDVAPYMLDTVLRTESASNVQSEFLSYKGTALRYIIVNSIKELAVQNDSLLQVIENLHQEFNWLSQVINQCCESEASQRIGNPNESDMGKFVVMSTDPNPFSDQVSISVEIPSAYKQAKVVIYDTNGNKINEFNVTASGKGRVTLYGSEIASGLYFCSLVVDGEVLQTNQLVKR